MFSANSSQVSDDKLFVEDVFSTYLYTGNGSTQTITNGIDLAGKGGIVWCKSRVSTGNQNNVILDPANSIGIYPNLTNQKFNGGLSITQYYLAATSTGFTFPTGDNVTLNTSATNYTSWTFRKAPKFFDVVTYTGNDTSRSIAHSLGVAPGCIIVKNISQSGFNWVVYHRSTGATQWLKLNLTDAVATNATYFPTDPTATTFAIGSGGLVNNGGDTYVAYLFAHDTTSDGIIQCGSFTNDGSGNATVNLGWEPQWVLIKSTASTAYDNNWRLYDNMRGMPVADSGISTPTLYPNTSGAEVGTNIVYPTATGFRSLFENPGTNYIYIAIRRGPMRTPTSGTSVFSPIAVTPSSGTVSTTNFPTDMMLLTYRPGGEPRRVYDRLRGIGAQSPPPYEKLLTTNTTDAEADSTPVTYNWWNTGFTWSGSYAGLSMVSYAFRRAPSFFDEVCYTGTGNGVVQSVNHNLGVAPEMVIMKERTTAFYSWITWTTALNLSSTYGLLALNSNSGVGFSSNNLNSTAPTSTVVSVSADGNASGRNYVLYLFASCPGVSKVFSFTGNGSSQTINCGFSGGARFILIKRTDSTGNWVVFDSARGIVSGNDPSLLLNSTAAETNYDDIDPDSSGFIVNQSTNNLNVNGASYIGLAVA